MSLGQHIFEMTSPSLSPLPPRGTLGAAASPPVFTDTNGSPISSIVCGGSFLFSVPGYNDIWLTQYRDGTKIFDGMFSVPMPQYMSSCATDVGTYQVIAYDPITGIVLGQTTFTVLSASGAPGGAGGGLLSMFSNLSPATMAALAIGGFLLLKKKGRK